MTLETFIVIHTGFGKSSSPASQVVPTSVSRTKPWMMFSELLKNLLQLSELLKNLPFVHMVQTNMSTLNAQRFARAATRRPKYLLYFNKKREFLFELRSSFPSTRTLAYSYYRHASVGTLEFFRGTARRSSLELRCRSSYWNIILIDLIFNSELFGSERTRLLPRMLRNHFHKRLVSRPKNILFSISLI